MQWISVNDDLPEYGVEVLVVVEPKISLDYSENERYITTDRLSFWKNGQRDRFNADNYMGTVTHWMPLPPLPYKEKKLCWKNITKNSRKSGIKQSSPKN